METTSTLYSDFGYLATLRGEAQTQGQATDKETLEKVAQQFESLFVQMMLKSMREATKSTDSGLFSSDQMGMYQDMFDQQIALDLSKQGGIGLADILMRQLGGDSLPSSLDAAEQAIQSFGIDASQTINISLDAAVVNSNSSSTVPAAVVETVSQGPSTDLQAEAWRADSPAEFVEKLWADANLSAEQLSVAPEALIAQAALETGWGKQVIRNQDGSSSHNLFGIKAGSDWQGDKVITQTLEYKEGLMVAESHAFRSYNSVAEAFADYVGFLKTSPRYSGALAGGLDTEQFAEGLAEGGYATDPDYAQKIVGILNREEYQSLIQNQGQGQIQNPANSEIVTPEELSSQGQG